MDMLLGQSSKRDRDAAHCRGDEGLMLFKRSERPLGVVIKENTSRFVNGRTRTDPERTEGVRCSEAPKLGAGEDGLTGRFVEAPWFAGLKAPRDALTAALCFCQR